MFIKMIGLVAAAGALGVGLGWGWAEGMLPPADPWKTRERRENVLWNAGAFGLFGLLGAGIGIGARREGRGVGAAVLFAALPAGVVCFVLNALWLVPQIWVPACAVAAVPGVLAAALPFAGFTIRKARSP